MNFVDKSLACVECGGEFTHSAADQQRYAQRGYTNEPRRCPNCREKRRGAGGGGGGGGSRGGYAGGGGGGGGARSGMARAMFTAVCAECGQEAQLTFQPKGDRPVYCRDCFNSRRTSTDRR